MTTIVTNKKAIVADRRLVVAGHINQTVEKIIQVSPELIIASAGTMFDEFRAIQHFKKKNWPSLPPIDFEDTGFKAILWLAGDWFLCDGDTVPIPILDEFACIGSGAEFALAALHLGKTLEEAVDLASRLDVNTGNGIMVVYPPKIRNN